MSSGQGASRPRARARRGNRLHPTERRTPGSVSRLLGILVLAWIPFFPGTALGGINRWTTGGPISRASVSTLAIDPSNPLTVYAILGGRVFKSSKGGESWREIGAGLPAESAFALAIDPSAPLTLYVGGGGGAFKSVNGGESWSPVNTGLSNTSVQALGVAPSSPATLYAGTVGDAGRVQTLHRTTNAGASWSRADSGLDGHLVVALAIHPSDPSTVYAGVNLGGVYKTTDGGRRWREARTGLPEYEDYDIPTTVGALAIDPTAPSTVYATTIGGVFKTTDGGGRWNAANGGLPHMSWQLGALAIDLSSPSTLYTSSSRTGVLRSTDGGVSWDSFNAGLPDVNMGFGSPSVLAVDPTGTFLHAGGFPPSFEEGEAVFDYQFSQLGLTLPAAASLHGVNDAFFHSDVSVFNAATSEEAVLTARYRCFSGECGEALRAISIPPRQVRVFSDIVASLFAAPETGGALEFESTEAIVVTSRLYTPSKPSPTVGQFVPGLLPEEGYPVSVLTALSHSPDLSTGFRTNVGVYNGSDLERPVTFSLFSGGGALLGQTTRPVAPRSSLQINNIFGALGIGTAVADAYCVVRADGTAPLFAYAAVIDNQSQDPVFIQGKDASGSEGGLVTLPAAASLHGAGEAFFHSDVTVFNTSSTEAAAVTARYRCFSGSCGEAVQTFSVPPRQTRFFEDIVVGLFGAPETAGAVEFQTVGGIVVESRLYTPSRPVPTYGMSVPGLSTEQGFPEAVLTSLSHSADTTKRFRTNVGAYNGDDLARTVTFTLHDAMGVRLGETSRLTPARTPVQINNIAGALGIATDLESFYCVIRGEGTAPLFAYAAVIDNQSQDPIFVRGAMDEPE